MESVTGLEHKLKGSSGHQYVHEFIRYQSYFVSMFVPMKVLLTLQLLQQEGRQLLGRSRFVFGALLFCFDVPSDVHLDSLYAGCGADILRKEGASCVLGYLYLPLSVSSVRDVGKE